MTTSRSSRLRYDPTLLCPVSNLLIFLALMVFVLTILQHSKGNQEAENEANQEAEKQIQTIKEAGERSQTTVVKNLLSAVFEVHPVPPSKA